MRLFDEMEKCFPEMEKHYQKLMPPDDIYWTKAIDDGIRFEMYRWIETNYLEKEETILFQFFCMAGVSRKRRMAMIMYEWMLYDISTRKRHLNRADISPAQE